MLKRLARWVLRTELAALKRAIQHTEPRVEVSYSHRIPRDVWENIKRQLPAHLVSSSSTQLQVAALVGQQQVVTLVERELVL